MSVKHLAWPTPAQAAKRIGFPLPVDEFGVVEWQDQNGPDLVVAIADGLGEFTLQVFQVIGNKRILTDYWRVHAKHPTRNRCFSSFKSHDGGYQVQAVLDRIVDIVRTLGDPASVDSSAFAEEEADAI